MEFRGGLYLATAGNALRAVKSSVAKNEVSIEGCYLADYFGTDAKLSEPAVFNFDWERGDVIWLEDKTLGFDFALIPLGNSYRDRFLANGVVPIAESNWREQTNDDYDLYLFLGFPAQYARMTTIVVGNVEQTVGIVEPIMMTVSIPDKLPDGVPKLEAQFVGQLPLALDLPNLSGMSGGPILGLKLMPGGNWRYWAVAMGTSLLPSERLMFGCRVPSFASLAEAELKHSGLGSIDPTMSTNGHVH